MYACNGILFNHESPLRGETFVTRKITRAIRCRRRWPSGSWRSQGESARVPRLSGLAIRARRVRRDFDRSASTCRRTNFPSRLACASFSSAVLRKRSLSGAHCGIEDRCKGAARAPGVALRFIRRQGLESHILASVWKPRCPRPDRRGRQEMADPRRPARGAARSKPAGKCREPRPALPGGGAACRICRSAARRPGPTDAGPSRHASQRGADSCKRVSERRGGIRQDPGRTRAGPPRTIPGAPIRSGSSARKRRQPMRVAALCLSGCRRPMRPAQGAALPPLLSRLVPEPRPLRSRTA